MPLPKPKKDESKKDFLNRCMGNSIMNEDFPGNDQRYAVCNDLWKKKEKKDMNNDVERRFLNMNDTEVRVIKEDGKTKLVGYFAKFDTLSDNLGGFREKIEKGFFREALKTSDVVDLFNHDANFVLGRMSAGTLSLKEDSTGLKFECIAPDTQLIRDLVLSPIERGDIKGCSFGFRIASNGDKWEEDDEGRVVRTLLKDGCSELLDGSQVTFPAYPDANVALRALEGWKEMRDATLDEKVEAKVKAVLEAKEEAQKKAAAEAAAKVAADAEEAQKKADTEVETKRKADEEAQVAQGISDVQIKIKQNELKLKTLDV